MTVIVPKRGKCTNKGGLGGGTIHTAEARGRSAQTFGGCDCPDHNQDSRVCDAVVGPPSFCLIPFVFGFVSVGICQTVPNSCHLDQHSARYLIGSGLRHYQARFGELPILFRLAHPGGAPRS
jgi:hypothetical protein